MYWLLNLQRWDIMQSLALIVLLDSRALYLITDFYWHLLSHRLLKLNKLKMYLLYPTQLLLVSTLALWIMVNSSAIYLDIQVRNLTSPSTLNHFLHLKYLWTLFSSLIPTDTTNYYLTSSLTFPLLVLPNSRVSEWSISNFSLNFNQGWIKVLGAYNFILQW